ncbi:MAG: hypothetical protein H7Y38_08710, partial [Armatimonadetes bacterium]|nr:hypothetical protein [Armatimonadota bacterium]
IEWQWGQTPRYRHSGVSNMAFADGHVKAVAKGQLNWCKNFYYPGIGNAGPFRAVDVSYMFNTGEPCAGFTKE